MAFRFIGATEQSLFSSGGAGQRAPDSHSGGHASNYFLFEVAYLR